MLSMVAEWWAAEFRGLIAGWIDSTPPAPPVATIMAANGVVFMFTVVFYQIPKGLGIASSVRCGNALGAGMSSINAS
jgi:Na+-driven multidrug efflux pump